jgi:hypothetical protein
VRGLGHEAALEALIDETLMLHEATRLPQVALLPEEEERALQALLEAHPAAADSIPHPALRRLARREALILRYVELRFRPLVRISDAELRAEYERRSATEPFEQLVPEIEAALVRAALDRRIEEWVADLRERGSVVYVPEEAP